MRVPGRRAALGYGNCLYLVSQFLQIDILEKLS
jgi:hypothetical protein